MIEGGYKSGCRGYCAFPHGVFISLAAIIVALISLSFSIGVHVTCVFVRADDVYQTGFGIWRKENVLVAVHECQEYSYLETRLFDTKWNAAAGLSYTAGVIGFTFTILLMGITCAAFHRLFFQLTAAFFITAGIFDFCTLVAIDSNICTILTLGNVEGRANTCTFSTGAYLAIVAGICYFVTAILVYCIPGPRIATTEETAEEGGGASPAVVVEKEDALQEEERGEKDNKDDDSSSSSSSSDDDAPRSFCVSLTSNILFLIGSVFFMWLAVMDLSWVKTVRDFVDMSLQEKQDYQRAHLLDDDIVFQTSGGHNVSQYQIVYFIAAAAFMVEGFFDFFATPGIRGLFFIFAGTFGLVSAWLTERDADLAIIFGLMSAHLYVLEAVGLVINREEGYKGWLKHLLRANDICFVVATTIDLVLSYFDLVGRRYNLPVARADTAAASLWLLCAVFYVCATFYAKRKGYFDQADDDSDDGTPLEEAKVEKNEDVEEPTVSDEKGGNDGPP